MPVISDPPDAPHFKTRAEAVAYYTNLLKKLPGTYKGNLKKYDGKTWAEIYVDLAKAYPQLDPEQLAKVVLDVEAAQRLGIGLQGAENELGKFIATSEKAVASTDFLPNPLAGLLSPLSHLAAVFDAVYRQLTKASMWRSLGWTVLGGILLIAGIVWWAKTEASGVIKNVL